MADIQTIKKLLLEEYGIKSAAELEAAIRKVGKLNIGVCASPTRKKGAQREKKHSAA